MPKLPEDKIAKFIVPLKSINYAMLITKALNFYYLDKEEAKAKKAAKVTSPKVGAKKKGKKAPVEDSFTTTVVNSGCMSNDED